MNLINSIDYLGKSAGNHLQNYLHMHAMDVENTLNNVWGRLRASYVKLVVTQTYHLSKLLSYEISWLSYA